MASIAVLLLAAFIVFNGGCGVFCNTENCETGKSCTVNPGVAKPETFVWKYSKTNDNVIKVLDWDPQIEEPNNTHWFPLLENRAKLDPKTAALTILHVKKEDSGFYTCEIQMDGALKYFNYEVKVFDPVTKPEIKCVLNDTVVTALVCSVDPQVQATIKWQIPNEGKSEGMRIVIPEGQSEDSVYYCIATNPVSNNSTELTLKNCKDQPGPGPGLGLIVGIVFPVVILLIAGILGFLFRDKLRSFLQTRGFKDVPMSETEASGTSGNGTNPDHNNSNQDKIRETTEP